MKKRNDSKKEVRKIKRTENSKTNKRRNQTEPDLWKEIRSNLKPIGKAYNKFREKRRIAKQKEEEKRLKEEEKQRLRKEETQRLQEEEERRLKRLKKIKEEKEKKLKAQEKQRLEEKRLIEERNERIKQEQIYRERLIKGEEERIKQLERVKELREEERKLREERSLKIESSFVDDQRLNDEKQRLKEEEQRLKEKEQRLKEEEQRLNDEKQRLKEEEIMNLKVERRSNDEQNKKKLNGTIKWFNDAKGYGFIKREDKEKDIFVHFSAIQNSGLEYLKKGEQVTFEVEYFDRGPSAVNLQKIVNEVSRSHLKVIK